MLTMRLTLGSLLTTLACVLLSGSLSVLLAQQPGRPNPTGQTAPRTAPQTKPGAPGAQPKGPANQGPMPSIPTGEIPLPKDYAEEKLSPELEELLKQWELRSADIKALQGQHTRTIYNLVFQEEKIAQGKFYLETPDKGRIDLRGLQPKKGEQSARIGKNGEPYKLVADRPESWICTGDEIIVANVEEKTYEVLPLPAEAKGKNIVNTPLPFLFGMKVADTKRRFQIKLQKNSKEEALLFIVPRFASDQQNYVEARVILEKKNYLPTAVKLFDQSGNIETVYKFEEVDVTLVGERPPLIKIFPQPDPFHPDLKKAGYTLVLPPLADEALPKSAQNTRPTSSGQRSIPPEAPRNGSSVKPTNTINRK